MKFVRMILVSIITLGISTSVFATNETEKGELLRIAKEIKFLKSEVNRIKSLQRVDDTESFNYQALISDLDDVAKAITRHVNTPSRQPKKVNPLILDYDNLY